MSIYNHLTDEEKEKFENKKIKDKEFADNSRYIIKILMFILMIVFPPLLVIFIIFMLGSSDSKGGVTSCGEKLVTP